MYSIVLLKKCYPTKLAMTCKSYYCLYDYEGGSINQGLSGFLAFNFKRNTSPVKQHSSIDYCQVLSKLRPLVCVEQPLKQDNKTNLMNTMRFLHVQFEW